MTDEKTDKQTGEITSMPTFGLGELQSSATASAVIQEVQGAMLLAKHFPRDYEAVWQKLMAACKRKTLAATATYSFPRGGKSISGPSINLARVAAQCYSNIRTGLDILRDDEDTMHIRAWAWDIENNVKVTADDSFKKLVQRKQGQGQNRKTVWVKPDERDLRELMNRRGAILKRNCIFECMPRDLIEDAEGVCKKTIKQDIKDPKSEAKRIILEFGDMNITVEQVRKFIGHNNDWTSDDIVELQGVLNSINDGNSKLSDYFGKNTTPREPAKPTGAMSTDDMKPGDASTHKGYGDPPEDKPKADTKTAEPSSADIQKELIEACKVLEDSKDFGATKLIDVRVEHLEQADFSTASIDSLQIYLERLRNFPDKKKSGDF